MQLLSCHACLWHCLRAVTSRAQPTFPNALARRAHLQRAPTRALVLALQQHKHSYATETGRIPDAFDRVAEQEKNAFYRNNTTERRRESGGFEALSEETKKDYYRGDAFKRRREVPYFKSHLRRELDIKMMQNRIMPGKNALTVKTKRQLQTELEWFGKDPLKLAERVRKQLEKGEDEKALNLVRFASKSMECVVSWNHLIDHYMANGRVSQGVKLYNEMKKRAQMPDSYTYMIVLRGLGNNAHINSSVGHALVVYHSMSAPNSRVRPSTMHVNAALRVCARSNNMNALWGIAAKLPENGPGSADALTYTTILQGMRQEALLTPRDMSSGEVAHKREAAIIDARRIWEDIVNKWRAGNIVIDEELACAMGKMLLIGQRPRDWDDVFSLFEQTMDIPRLVPILGSGSTPKFHLPNTPSKMKTEDFSPVDPTDHLRRGGEFDPVKLEKTVGGGRQNMAYAKPGNHTLAVILEACLQLTLKKTAEDYWNLLTAPDSWGIVPDEVNLHMYLLILRKAHASKSAVEFLSTDFEASGLRPKPKTFRIAMSSCLKDGNNPKVFAHANAILDMMASTLPDPDLRTLIVYAKVVANLPRPEEVLDGLDRLGPQLVNVKNMLKRERYHKDVLTQKERNFAVEFIWELRGCYDRLINKAELPRERIVELTARKGKVDSFLSREMRKVHIDRGVDVRNPDLNPGRRAEEDEDEDKDDDKDDDKYDDTDGQATAREEEKEAAQRKNENAPGRSKYKSRST